MGRNCVLHSLICCIVNTCGIWIEFRNLNITENKVFRRYKKDIIHSVSYIINGLVTESGLVPNEQDTTGMKKPDILFQRVNRNEWEEE